MARKFLVAIDLGTNELQNAVIQNLAAASEPTGVKGRIYFDSTNNIIKFYDGSSWKAIATGGDLGSYQPVDGDLTAISALTGTGILTRTGTDTWSLDTNTYLTSTDLNGYVTETGTQTLTNKTFGNTPVFFLDSNDYQIGKITTSTYNGHSSLQIDAQGTDGAITLGAGHTQVYGDWDLGLYSASGNITLTSNSSDIILQPDGFAKVWTDRIVTESASQTLSNKSFTGIIDIFASLNTSSTIGYAFMQYDDTVSGDEKLIISSSPDTTTNQVGGKMDISSYGDMTITSTAGNMQFFMDGGMYIGNVDSGNQIVKQSDLSLFLTNAVTSIANTDGNISFSASTGSVTANLANDIEIAGGLTVQGDLTVNGNVTTLNTATMNVEDNIFLLNSNVTGTPVANAGLEVERGDDTNATILWNETANQWEAGLVGSTAEILLSGIATASDISGFNTAVDTEIDSHLSGSNSISYSSGAIDTTLATTSYLSKSSGLAVDVSTLETKLVTDGFTKKYAANNGAINISGGVATWTVTHNLGSRDVNVQVYEISGYGAVEVDVVRTSTSVVTLSWNASANVSADTYRVVVTG